LVGLAIAVANIDEVIRVIRTSPDPNTARETLMSRDWPAKDMATMITLIDDPRHRVSEDGTARLSLEQAKAILDLRLQRLTALGREEISEELTKLATEIADYLDILRSRARIQSIIKDELTAVKDEFATPRRTMIIDQEGEVEDEDLIQREDMVVTVSHAGYVKRVPLSTYRAQKRGGKAVQACRRAMRISSAGCSSPRRIRRCCSSRPAGRSTRRRSGGCRWPLRTHAARR
jgi:DNA gyrase subunit A